MSSLRREGEISQGVGRSLFRDVQFFAHPKPPYYVKYVHGHLSIPHRVISQCCYKNNRRIVSTVAYINSFFTAILFIQTTLFLFAPYL